MKRSLFFTTLLLTALTTTYGQQEYTQIPAAAVSAPLTPEVRKLMGQIVFPVDYTTGLASVEIPIYEIKLKNLTLPIKLTYNSSGFKPQVLSEAGTGWVLTAEPYVVRQVNGFPDERHLYTDWLKTLDQMTMHDRVDMAIGEKDAMPDRFFYHLPGKTGSFFTKRDFIDPSVKGFATVPHDPLKISAPADLHGLTIVDTDGTEYLFSGQESVHRVFRNLGYFYDSAYKASAITTVQGDTVRFEYQNPVRCFINHDRSESGSLELLTWTAADWDPYDVCDRFGYARRFGYSGDDLCPPSGSSTDYYRHRIKYIQHIPDKETLYHVKRGTGTEDNVLNRIADRSASSGAALETNTSFCSKIIFPGGTVEIILAEVKPGVAASLGLRSITVRDSNGNVVRRAEFDMDYDTWQRLRLDGVRFVDSQGITQEEYGLEYDHSAYISGVPHDTWKANSWGYYQEDNDTYKRLPQLSTHFSMYMILGGRLVQDAVDFRTGTGRDYYKTSASQVIQVTMLKSISYPTRGRSVFTYEPAKFRHSGRDQIVYTGALRIKSISNYLENGTLRGKRVFSYGTDNSGLGISVDELADSDFISKTEIRNIAQAVHIATREIYQLHASPFAGNSLSASTSIVYDRVEERLEDRTGSFEGKTEYLYDYSNVNYIKDRRVAMTPYYFKKYQGWNIGQLREKNVYSAESPTRPVFKSTWRYTSLYNIEEIQGYAYYPVADMDYQEGGWTHKLSFAKGLGSPFPMTVTATALYFSSGAKLLDSQTDTEYMPDGTAVSTTTEYGYNHHLLPVAVHVTGSDGIPYKTVYGYPTDAGMVNRNILTPVVSVEKYKGNAKIHAEAIRYTAWMDRYYVPNVFLEYTKDGEMLPVKTYSQFNRYGRPVSATDHDAYPTTYIWGNKGQQLVAEIKGVAYSDVQRILGDQLIRRIEGSAVPSSGDMAALNHLRSSLPGAQITTYEHKPLVGVTAVTDPRGFTIYYDYDAFGRLKEAYMLQGPKRIIEAYKYNYRKL